MTLTIAALGPGAVDAANPEPQIFTIDQLAISPLNVRFNEEDSTAVEALSASIVAEGLLQSLVLHPAPPKAKWAGKAKYGVFAGGRRYRAIRRAIDAGELPPDFPIKATVRDLPAGQIILLSLSENLLRRDLRDYEVHAAIAAARKEGLTVAQISAQTGQRPAEVAKWARLGELAPEILAAYIAGQITTEQAKAFGATDDHALQAQAWAHFGGAPNAPHPGAIRAYFKVGDHKLVRDLQFVGEAIYRANGGRFELDLFASGPDAMRGRVVDEGLLSRLVEEKMEVVRGQVRSAWGESELRFQGEPPRAAHGGDDHEIEVRPIKRDWETARIPRKADPANFVATIEIESNGEWAARLWWTSRKAKAAFEKPKGQGAASSAGAEARSEYGSFAEQALRTGRAGSAALEGAGAGYGSIARQIAREDHGLTADGVNVVRTIRRDLLRWALLCSPERDVPGDYLTWSALRQELASDRSSRTGARGLASEGWTEGEREPADLMKDQREGQEGYSFWQDRVEVLCTHPAFAGKDPAEALRAYLSASPALKRTAEAVLAGLALVRSCASPGWDVATHNVLIEALGFTPGGLRHAWRPTAAFTGLFGKLPRLGLVQDLVDEGERRQLAKAKDKDLSRRTAELLAARADWLHPLLAFVPSEQAADAEPQAAPVEPELTE